ncbi:hypothetical protein [Glacieibacterium frigidum]|uniref:Uncharacterized protein n=1 Tax=Glacieibacterium frigidum TaxID=2593303 RepID=A0A552UG58_9SPHN|nr:hypothetical protein [Glacieibacterium frigidum]TRW17212.1 hypothetical protein FMM06_03180 [Glacieibacterium frigidum]
MTALAIDSAAYRQPPAARGDLCNLLQVAASALHLIERQLDDDLRPLIRVGLAAIGQAAATANPTPQAVAPRFARMIP